MSSDIHTADWINDTDGRAECTKHRPPSGTWRAVTLGDIWEHEAADLAIECETCANQAGRSTAHKVRR